VEQNSEAPEELGLNKVEVVMMMVMMVTGMVRRVFW
jgi:hypothetical protein